MKRSYSAGESLVTHIYTLHDPRTGEIRYVGKTSNTLARRLTGHIYDARSRRRQGYVINWIRQLLDLGLRPEIHLLQSIIGASWIEAEQFWIAYFRAQGSPLTNLTDGGEGHVGHTPSPETTAKRSASLSRYSKSRPRTHNIAISQSMTKPIEESQHALSRFSDPQRPEEWRSKIGEANRGDKNGAAKLSAEQVYEIKLLLMSNDYTRSEIAARFEVSPALIRLIRLGDRWAHIPWPNETERVCCQEQPGKLSQG